VKFAPGVSAAGKNAALAAHGATLRRTIPEISRSLVEVNDPGQARQSLERDPRIAAVELNHIRHALATPNDPRFAGEQQYLLPLRLPAAWSVTQGSTGVKIAIVDTGVDLDHPDLASRIVAGYDSSTATPSPRTTRGTARWPPALPPRPRITASA
jgi:thermitase